MKMNSYIVHLWIVFHLVTKGWSEYACKTYQAYLSDVQNNKDCHIEPDVLQNSPQILERHFGYYENHTITTHDGYILHMFSVPRENSKGVIVLFHPMFSDAVMWIGQGNESLAILLWNQGYEIWMPNFRGTFFSKKHTHLTSKDLNYWNFSFHEMGTIDHKYVIDYIVERTNRSDLIHIGYSMGSTSGLIYASTYPIEAKEKVKVFIELAPAVFFEHTLALGKTLAPYRHLILRIAKSLGRSSLLEYNSIEGQLFRRQMYSSMKRLAIYILCYLVGWTPDEFDPKLYTLFFSLHTRGIPLMVLAHYGQFAEEPKHFRGYNYGPEENKRIYANGTPPIYRLQDIKTPVFLISSTHDIAATYRDADSLFKTLSKEAKIYGQLVVSGINHFDFMYGKTRIKKVFEPIFKLLRQI